MTRNIWKRIMEFESHDLVKNYILEKHARQASAKQITEITSNIIQGREYFKNAANADILVKPLLLFYGVAALSRALILSIKPKLSASSLKPAHGLETENWQEALANNNFSDFKVLVRKGAFLDLLEATGNKSYFKNLSSGISWHGTYNLPQPGTSMTLNSLLKYFSDLTAHYEKWRAEKIDYLPITAFKPLGEGRNEYSFALSTDQLLINRKFLSERFKSITIEKKRGNMVVVTDGGYAAQFTQRFHDPFGMGIGEIVITSSPWEKECISTLGQFYSLSYYLGMLARYFPSNWVQLGRGVKGDSIFPLVRQSIDLIEQYYPAIICEFLDGPYPYKKEPA